MTHNHPEGIKGAQATAVAIFLARTGKDKATIKDYIEKQFDYDLSQSLNKIRPRYHFDVSCQGSVPQSIVFQIKILAGVQTLVWKNQDKSWTPSQNIFLENYIIAFLESENYEDAVRNAISLGGDSDTMACIAGGIAEAFYGEVPHSIQKTVFTILDKRLTEITKQFMVQYSL